jgi:hypothetical protein
MDIENESRVLAKHYSEELAKKIEGRRLEMLGDDKSHYMIYRLLGISLEAGLAIDLYQNTGRFLYRYAGTFLERVSKLCFESKFPEATSVRIPNKLSSSPKTFEIDCLVGLDAYEIKWRDATTDGDHIIKEHSRIRAIAAAGYNPIRLMYYYPNRRQATRIQSTIADLYRANQGHYYYGESAWQHLKEKTDIDLRTILESVANERMF